MRFPVERLLCIVAIGFCVSAGTASSGAAELPGGFIEETLVEEINAATAMTIAPDGRVFYAEQTGPLRVWKEGRLLPTPALDLSERLDSFWERGLIGLTLHPDFPHSPYLFVVYVAKEPYTHHVVSRFTVAGDWVDPSSEQILLEGDDQSKLGGNVPAGHQGGPICVGPDGKIYVGIGEQTAGKPSQSLTTLQGKILRINPDGSIPEDNPFYEQTTGKYRAIWAIGIRNPFGLAFEPETGRLFETDVGQSSFEEVNVIVAGGNYGWPQAEGPSDNPGFVNPIYAYPPVIGRSICGGAFYPKTGPTPGTPGAFPVEWRGRFFFVDWASHWVKALDPNAPANVTTFARGFDAPVGIAVAPDGSLFVLNRGTIWRDGKKFEANSGSLVRIRYVGGGPEASRHTAPRPALPETLSESRLFKSLDPLLPNQDFLAFEINAPPWQPGVRARRWISVPPEKAIRFSAQGEWEFPAETIVVQHYVLEDGSGEAAARRPFETHLLWFNGPRSVRAAAYRWSQDRTVAARVDDAEIVPLSSPANRFWFSPGFEHQLNLDLVVTGFLLPVSTRQLNRAVPDPRTGRPVNQLKLWNDRGWFDPPLTGRQIASLPRLAAVDDDDAPARLRVRSYLDVNCAACHRPGGPSRGNFDARFATALGEQNLLGGELVAGDLGIPGARVIVPGQPDKSVLYQRLRRHDFFRMPPVSVNNEAQPVLPVLEDWIRSLASN